MDDTPLISVIIPNRNSAGTLGECLGAACAQQHVSFEVIVVDDCSTDGSPELIRQYPVRLIELPRHGGASRARNTGAQAARGQALFFIDADCVMQPDTLSKAAQAVAGLEHSVVGGTYTPLPHDRGFFSTFQSIYINHSETKGPEPDYIATHAMLISREAFESSGGFRAEDEFMPILEDVELSHRLRDSGMKLVMRPEIQVSHIFNFTLWRSLRNAFRKSMYWVRYSKSRGDLASDSGTASLGLKAMAGGLMLTALMLMAGLWFRSTAFLLLSPGPMVIGILNSRDTIFSFFHYGGLVFGLMATLYYVFIYPIPAALVGLAGLLARRPG